jgi:hypothetical protein
VRKANLFRSIARLLDDGTQVVEAVYMWRRHRLMFPFGIVSFLGMLVVAEWAGWDEWATRVVIGLAAVAVAVAASTDYRVLAHTTGGLFLFQASRIRQVATRMLEKLPPDVPVEPVGGTILAADWAVAGSVYTVPRSSEQAISRIAGRV